MTQDESPAPLICACCKREILVKTHDEYLISLDGKSFVAFHRECLNISDLATTRGRADETRLRNIVWAKLSELYEAYKLPPGPYRSSRLIPAIDKLMEVYDAYLK